MLHGSEAHLLSRKRGRVVGVALLVLGVPVLAVVLLAADDWLSVVTAA